MLGANTYPRRGRYGLTTTTATPTGSSNTFLVRPRLPLRSYARPKTATNLLGAEVPNYGRSKRLKSRKLNGYQKVDPTKKKVPDYTDFAYREAVSKLKYLLAESYTPRVTPRKLLHGGGRYNNPGDSNPKINIESGEETDDRSVASEVSQVPTKAGLLGNLPPRSSNSYLPRPKNSQLSRGCSNLALLSRDPQSAPPELMSFIERQEEYIEQLERESQYCRGELTNLLGKVREVVAENESLHDKSKNGFLKSVTEEYGNNSEEENLQEPNESQSSPGTLHDPGKGKRVKLHRILEGPSIVFESRISELEAQLTQARVELRKVQEENQANLRRLSENSGGDAGPEIKAQLERALRDKREAETKLEELQRNLATVRDREADTSHKAKRTLDVLEQAQFEKTQAEAELRRLRDELDRQHERLREASQEASRRVAEERHQIERRYSQQVEQLSADVASHWDVASKSQLEAEKQRREMGDLRRDLAQKQALIDELKKELQSKISAMQSDLSQAIAEKDAAEQEISAAKLAAERAERQGRQEQNRLQSEINSYKQRLERADADLVHCRRENLRLTEQIAALEKEVNLSKMINSDDHRTPGATPRGVDNDKELTSMIMDIETKHAATVAGLEDALASQATAMSQLSVECQSLTQRLEDNSLKHNYSVLTEGIVQSDEGAIAMTAPPPASKKRTVKVDLKVKVIPKKKSGRSDSAKTPLSAQEEMASLQSNLNYLTSQIQDSLVHQNDHPDYKTSPKNTTVGAREVPQLSSYPEESKGINSIPGNTQRDVSQPQETVSNDPSSVRNRQPVEGSTLLDKGNRDSRLQQSSNVVHPPRAKENPQYTPDQDLQDYAADTDQNLHESQYSAVPATDSTEDVQLHGVADEQQLGNYEPGITAESDYKMENYNPTDNQHYDPRYTDQSYDQYNQQQYEGQYQPEQYEEGGTAGQYQNEDMYQNMQYEGQEYQEYPEQYNEHGTAELSGDIQPEKLLSEAVQEPQTPVLGDPVTTDIVTV